MDRLMFMFVSLVLMANQSLYLLWVQAFASRDEGDKIYTAKVPVDIEAGKTQIRTVCL